MANSLTGDFDLVLEMTLERINRILAAQHQAGVFPHSFTVRIDDTATDAKDSQAGPTPTPPKPVAPAPASPEQRPGQLAAPRRPIMPIPPQAPLSVGSAVLQDDAGYSAFLGYRGLVVVSSVARLGPILKPTRLWARVQSSTPTVTLPKSGTRVTLVFNARAQVSIDPGSTYIPEFLHGDVALTVDVTQVAVQKGMQFVLDFDFLSGNLDVKYTPAPGSGTSQKDVDAIEWAIYSLMASGFVCGSAVADVPSNVQDMQLKGLSGNPSAVALLMNLGGTYSASHGELTTPSSPASVKNVFVGADDDFAVGVGSDYIVRALALPITLAAEDVRKQITDPQSIISVAAVPYKLTVPGTNIDLAPGILRVTVTFHAHRETPLAILLPEDVDIRLIQEFTLSLNNDHLAVVPNGDLRVEVSPGFTGDSLLIDEINKQMTPARKQQLIDVANGFVGSALGNVDFGGFLSGLEVPSAQAHYKSVEITPDGVILRGRLQLGAWQKPTAVNDGATVVRNGQQQIRLDAFGSWIPGGTVGSYTWKNGTATSEDHAFVKFMPYSGTGGPGRWCVRVQGTQTTDTGSLVNVDRWSCLPYLSVLGQLPGMVDPVDVPRRDRHVIVVPRPGPDPVPDAYVDPWGAGLTSAGTAANVIVHFADEVGPAAPRTVHEALARSGLENTSVFLIMVLPRGGLKRAAAVSTGFRAEGPRGTSVQLALTEDFEGAWRRTFDQSERVATYLLGSLGHVRWRHAGRLDVEPLAAALREHAVAKGPLRHHPLSLRVQAGDRAPDFRFELIAGHAMPVRRLRRQPMTLVFWTSWAESSLAELKRLSGDSSDGRLVLAINDGEDAQHAREVFERNRFTSHFVPDPDRTIATTYGVNCWPTIVEIEGHGRVWNVQMGATHHEDVAPERGKSGRAAGHRKSSRA